MMTCLFNFLGLRIVNYLTFTFTFFILADGNWSTIALPVVCDYLSKSPGRRIANYTTFTFACFIPQKLKWQSFVAAWETVQAHLLMEEDLLKMPSDPQGPKRILCAQRVLT